MSHHEFINYLLEGIVTEDLAPKKAKTISQLSADYKRMPKNKQKDIMDKVKEVYQNNGKFESVFKTNGGDMVRVIHHLLTDANKGQQTYMNVQEIVDKFVEVYSSLRHADLSKLEPVEYEPNKDASKEQTDVIEWKPYAKFREDMYKVTVSMGWPANLKPDPKNVKKNALVDDEGKEKSSSELWKALGKTPRIFEGWTLPYLEKTTNTIKTYLMTKFKGDMSGIQKLRGKVDSILEQEKQYFSTSSPLKKGISIVSNLAKFVFMGLGGQERDLAFFKWIGEKRKTMTIFEYQAAILNDVILRMGITDNTAESLKKSLTSVYNATKKFVFVDSKIGTVEPIKTESSWSAGLIAYFLVKSSKQTTAVGVIEDLYFALMNGGDEKANNPKDPNYEPKGVIAQMSKNSVASQNFSSGPSIKDITTICKQAVLKTAGHTDRTAFRNSIKDGLVFELLNKNSKGEVIGTYTWKVYMVTRAVRFELKYEKEESYNGGEE